MLQHVWYARKVVAGKLPATAGWQPALPRIVRASGFFAPSSQAPRSAAAAKKTAPELIRSGSLLTLII